MMRAVSLLAVCSLAACDLVRDPTALAFDHDIVAVHGMLRTGSVHATVLVSRVADADDWLDPTVAVTGASVRLSSATMVAVLHEVTDAAVCYSLSSLTSEPTGGCYATVLSTPVSPGATYELTVELKDGTTITGSTTVPHPVPLRADPEHATLVASPDTSAFQVANSVHLDWETQPAGTPLTLSIALDDASCQATVHVAGGGHDVALDVSSRSAADLGVRFVFCGQQQAGPHSGHVVLTRYDDNYRGVLELDANDEMVSPTSVAFGLQGGAGVFASSATSVVPVTVLRR